MSPSKIYTINVSRPSPVFSTTTAAPSIDEDFSVMFYNHSKSNFQNTNSDNTTEDSENYAFDGNVYDEENKGT